MLFMPLWTPYEVYKVLSATFNNILFISDLEISPVALISNNNVAYWSICIGFDSRIGQGFFIIGEFIYGQGVSVTFSCVRACVILGWGTITQPTIG
jgi:hypothetical protein